MLQIYTLNLLNFWRLFHRAYTSQGIYEQRFPYTPVVIKYELKNTLPTNFEDHNERPKHIHYSIFVIGFFLTLFRSCAQGQKQELFQCEAFCAHIDVSTRKDMTILASPMLGTLDVALHEDVFSFAGVWSVVPCKGHFLTDEIVMLHSRDAGKV